MSGTTDPRPESRRGSFGEAVVGFSRKLFLGEGPWGNLVAAAGLTVALGLVIALVLFMATNLPSLPLPGGGD